MSHIIGWFLCFSLMVTLGSSQPNAATAASTQSTATTSPTPTVSTTPIVEASLVAQHAPAKGPWSVMYKLTRSGGTSYYSGGSVKASSDGALENASWQNGFAGAEPSVTKGNLAPKAVATVGSALADPGLEDLPEGQGPIELTWTVNGKTKTVRSTSETFPGAAGRLVQALGAVAPLPPLKKLGP